MKLTCVKDIPFLSRLEALQIEYLETRRIKFDTIYIYKIIHQQVNVEFLSMFSFNTRKTRGNSFKLILNSYSFINSFKLSLR